VAPGSSNSNQEKYAEMLRQDAQRAHDQLLNFYTYVNQAAIKSAELALRMLLLINGAAAISLLTFIGTLPLEQKRVVAGTLVWFASGVALAVTGVACSYLTNYFAAGVANSKQQTWDHPYFMDGPLTKRYRILNASCHFAAIAVALASLGCFVVGMVLVKNALAFL
jgi:hypothetical protein